MSVFDLPRLNFRGIARVHAPTGDENSAPIFDVGTHRVYWEGERVGPEVTPREFHARVLAAAPRFGEDGRASETGPFSRAAGPCFHGNGHFSWQAQFVSVALEAGAVTDGDALVGRAIDVWGHHNPYLQTTFNRARWVPVDPTEPASASARVGRVAFGRGASSIEDPYWCAGDVTGPAWARRSRRDAIVELDDHWLAPLHGSTQWMQLAMPREALSFDAGALRSRAMAALARALDEDEVCGLVVRFWLFNWNAGVAAGGSQFVELAGCVAPWRIGERRSCPGGRRLTASRRGLGDLSLARTRVGLALDLGATQSYRGRGASVGDPFTVPELGPPIETGSWTIRLGDRAIATVETHAMGDLRNHGGVLDVPLDPGSLDDDGDWDRQPLSVTDARGQSLYWEVAPVVDCDDEVRVEVGGAPHPLSLWVCERGRPRPGARIRVGARAHHRARVRPEGGDGPLLEFSTDPDAPDGAWRGALDARADEDGRVLVHVRGATAGAGAIVVAGTPVAYARVMSDDRHLDAVADEDVDFDLLYREVFHTYELLYPFMSDEVFSLADRCRVETYARLIWQMSDPANAHATYYMPHTRDLTVPKIRLFRAYLANVERARTAPEVIGDPIRPLPRVLDREALIATVRRLIEIEQLVTLQYLYAAYSIPTYAIGQHWVAKGRWRREELAIACGDGHEGLDQGLRGVLVAISHEEMIHFLVANNLLRSLGHAFYAPAPSFDGVVLGDGCVMGRQPASMESLHALLSLELPAAHATAYPTIGGLYADVRATVSSHPEWITARGASAGGEHHLFLDRAVDDEHPDYQLEICDLRSALFAIDFVTGQGEGGRPTRRAHLAPCEGIPRGSQRIPEASHADRLRRLLSSAAIVDESRRQRCLPPWVMAYPTVVAPTLRDGGRGTIITAPDARLLMELVDASYALMLDLMALHFMRDERASLRRSRLMNASIDVMTGMLRPLLERLFALPAGVPGRTAGAAFEGIGGSALEGAGDDALAAIQGRFAALARRCQGCAAVPAVVPRMYAFYARYFPAMQPVPGDGR